MNQNLPSISVILITLNEERNIRDCLTSASWAEEIIVVDAESADDTVGICKEFESMIKDSQQLKLFVRPWPGFAEQKRFALEQATSEWVLSLDADERITPELASEIQTTLGSDDSFDGYSIPRLSTFLGKFIYHSGWYPGYQLRLFKREKTSVSQVSVHEGFEVEGKVGKLKNHILHFTHRNLEESFERMNRYSSLEAQDRVGQRVHWWDFFLHPLAAFWNKYIAKQGWRDGMHGLVLAFVTAMVKLALYLKLWERQKNERQKRGEENQSQMMT